MQRKRSSNWALIILLVVAVMMLFVCGAIALLPFIASRSLKLLGKSDIAIAKAQISSLTKSLDLYTADCRTYPTTEEGLQALISPPAMGETDGIVRGWDGPYLDGDSVPADPWGIPYGYSYPPTRGRGPGPDIWSMGPDMVDGTDDDIGNWNL